MTNTSNLPSLPSTVDLAGAPAIQGDPLEVMRNSAREAIDGVEKNALPNENEKIEFKKHVLIKLQEKIKKFDELDVQAAQKAQEESEKAQQEGAKEEEDPFADIFKDTEEQDETTKEKMGIAQKFISEIKMTREKFLKQVRVKREKQEQKSDENKMEEILGQLDEI